MIINMSGGGSGSDLNFRVYAAESLPSSGKENDVVVISSIPVIYWLLTSYSELPSFSVFEGVTILTSQLQVPNADGSIDILKRDNTQAIVELLGCMQYVTNDICRTKDAYYYHNGSWVKFSSELPIIITVSYPSGSTCTCSDGTTTLQASDTSGSYSFIIPKLGTWTITCTNGSESATASVEITSEGQTESFVLAYNQIPGFTYSGSYSITDDAGNIITTTKGNWNISFLSTGVLNISALNGAVDGIDIFLVGGGGSGGTGAPSSTAASKGGDGGSGGERVTNYGISVSAGTDYAITIGGSGGNSTAFGCTATAAGGSSGGSGSDASSNNPGSNGSDGGYPFNDSSYNTMYGGGGGGGGGTYNYGYTNWGPGFKGGAGGGGDGGSGGKTNTAGGTGSNGATNSGGGGGGGGSPNASGGSGGSGIVIIRNHRT